MAETSEGNPQDLDAGRGGSCACKSGQQSLKEAYSFHEENIMLNHPMRRSKKAVPDRSEMDAVILASPVMRLAMCRAGEPYVIPLSFGYDGEALFFHCAPGGLKVDVLENNPRVCGLFETGIALDEKGDNPCAWGFDFATVIVHGNAVRVTDPARRLTALQLITDHYAPGLRVPADKTDGVEVWRIDVLEMTGKKSG